MTRARARAVVEAIVSMRVNATDKQALTVPAIYPEWRSNVTYKTDDRVLRNNQLYKCRQKHTSQEIYPPEIVPALWAAISEDSGVVDAPITAVRGMEYEQCKYYLDTEDGKTYLCIRGGILHYLPHELVGICFEVVDG